MTASGLPPGTTARLMEQLFPPRRAEPVVEAYRLAEVRAMLERYRVPNPGSPVIPWTTYPPHSPTLPQQAFLSVLDEEALYGGAAGGGKSDGILMGALQYVDVPDYHALILRRTYPDLSLPGAIMDRANEWLRGTDASWNDQKKTWTFPESRAKLTFGFLQTPNDKYRYQSADFQYIGIDELTQIPLIDYLYMFSRLRKPAEGPLSRVPLRMRGASNPGGRHANWVSERFPVMTDDTPQSKEGRVFIPAKLDDNPHIDQESYRRSLSKLHPTERAQLEHGDWSVRQPGPWAFDHEHLDAAFAIGLELGEALRQGIMPEPVDGHIFFGQDYGEHSHLVIGYPLEGRGWFVTSEIVSYRGLPDEDLAPRAVEMAASIGWPVHRSRYDASKPESQRIFYRKTKELTGNDLYAKPSAIAFSKYKRGTILHVRRLLSRSAQGVPIGILAIDGEACPILKAQLYGLQYKAPDMEDLVKEEDHGPDAMLALIAPDSKRHLPSASDHVRSVA